MASIVGAGPSLAVVDELHLLGATPRGAKLVNQIRTGSVARREPLLVSISTAPVERSEGIFDTTFRKAERVISGKETDPRFLAWLCEIPEKLDAEDPANWHWSNPSLGYTVSLDRLVSDYGRAQSDPAALADFRSQNLNIRPDESAGEGRWLSMEQWDSCADPTLSMEDVVERSESLFVGCDVGGLDDLSAMVLLGKTPEGDVLVWSHQWLARVGYDKRRRFVDYDGFIEAGELTVFDDGGGDIDAVAKLVKQVAASGKLRLIGLDSYGAAGMAEALEPTGIEVVGVPQGWKLTPAIAWIERLIADTAFVHHGSGLLRWNTGNVVVTRHGNGRSISKATAVGSGKIDGIAALLHAAPCASQRRRLRNMTCSLSDGAARQRRRRQRQRAGKIVIPIEVDEAEAAVALVDAGLLRPGEAEDRRRLADALTEAVALMLSSHA